MNDLESVVFGTTRRSTFALEPNRFTSLGLAGKRSADASQTLAASTHSHLPLHELGTGG